jgi:hypothetical protein
MAAAQDILLEALRQKRDAHAKAAAASTTATNGATAYSAAVAAAAAATVSAVPPLVPRTIPHGRTDAETLMPLTASLRSAWISEAKPLANGNVRSSSCRPASPAVATLPALPSGSRSVVRQSASMPRLPTGQTVAGCGLRSWPTTVASPSNLAPDVGPPPDPAEVKRRAAARRAIAVSSSGCKPAHPFCHPASTEQIKAAFY